MDKKVKKKNLDISFDYKEIKVILHLNNKSRFLGVCQTLAHQGTVVPFGVKIDLYLLDDYYWDEDAMFFRERVKTILIHELTHYLFHIYSTIQWDYIFYKPAPQKIGDLNELVAVFNEKCLTKINLYSNDIFEIIKKHNSKIISAKKIYNKKRKKKNENTKTISKNAK